MAAGSLKSITQRWSKLPIQPTYSQSIGRDQSVFRRIPGKGKNNEQNSRFVDQPKKSRYC